jgi:molybdopterin-guanine dinucleotide biosynthesis protein B
MSKKPKLIFFVGYHNSGKTTLIEQVARRLTEMGYKVAYLKHDPKGHALTDKEAVIPTGSFKFYQRYA